MSPLDAARRLASMDPYFDWCDGAPDDDMVCIACDRYRRYGHNDDCPILGLPRIVAALEDLTP